MQMVPEQTVITEGNVDRIEIFSEWLFAYSFLQSHLSTTDGYLLIYQPRIFSQPKPTEPEKKESCKPDFNALNYALPKNAYIEVTTLFSLDQKDKQKQRRVMLAYDDDKNGYIQFPFQALVRPQWCWPIIDKVAKGQLSTHSALEYVDETIKKKSYCFTINLPPPQLSGTIAPYGKCSANPQGI